MLFATKPRQVGIPRDVLALIAVCVLMGFALVVTWSNLPDDNDRHFQLKLGVPGGSDPCTACALQCRRADKSTCHV
jgi:hypothetical protein